MAPVQEYMAGLGHGPDAATNTKGGNMYLQDFITDKGALIEKALTNPALHPKRNPTIEQALKAVVSEIEQSVSRHIADTLEPSVNDVYDMYEIENGEYATTDKEAQSDWESGLDDKVEEIFAPYTQHLSANWLAQNTIDTRLYEENSIRKLCESAGREIVKQLSAVSVQEQNQGVTAKTPAQILSNAGITVADVQIYLDQHLAPKTAEQETDMADATDDATGAVIQKMRAHLGSGFDIIGVYDDVELALDDDEILAHGAGARLGLDPEDVQNLQMLKFVHGESDTANVVMSMLDDTGDKPVKAPKVPKEPKEPKAAPAMGAEAADVLDLMIEHSGVADGKLGEAIGVSRATFNNYKSRKTNFAPDEMQKTVLRDILVRDLNGLYRALCIVDGVEVDREFD